LRAAVAAARGDAPASEGDAAGVGGLIGRAPALCEVRRLLPLLARSGCSVLLLGETGTGKELVARALHEQGPRAGGPFVAHNMAATPADLAESVFFGHVKGAFSGAAGEHPGLFEQAHGGTLFLDEVDSFPLPLQAKLLRALESARVRRVGGVSERLVDVRVIAATAADLETLVARGGFRADLYYRLRQLELVLPTLRDRREDIPLLVSHFLAELEKSAGLRPRLAPATLERLLAHDWPGNVRELRNAVRAAALLADGGLILPGHLAGALGRAAPRAARAADGPVALRDVECEHIRRVLARVGGNQSEAARLLGIDRGTLVRKLKAGEGTRGEA
jgi:DNA-binding NtrC family response regulator